MGGKLTFQCTKCGTVLKTTKKVMHCCGVRHEYPIGFLDLPQVQPPMVEPRDPVRNACVHRGQQIDTQQCLSCGGNIQIKIFECALYAKCTLQQPTAGACCALCGSYEKKTEATPELLESIRGPYVPREPGWEQRHDVIQAHKILFNEAVQLIPLAKGMPPEYTGKGIVILGGGSKYFACAYLLVTLLRRRGCTLPIEWWYLDHLEMDEQMMRLAESLGGVQVVNLQHRLDAAGRKPRMMGGWQAKAWGIMFSKFREVLFLDADQLPQRDPAFLFDDQRYLETGAVFWPDFEPMGWSITATAFEVAGLPVPQKTRKPEWTCPTDYEPFESGQILIDKERHWQALELTAYINSHADFWYAEAARDRHKWHVYGDKDTFYLAWHRLQLPFAMPPACRFSGDSETAGAFIQHDLDGAELFHHRVQPTSKWSLHGSNHSYPECTVHDECLEILRSLWPVWRGHPYDVSNETEEEQAISFAARGRKLWFRKEAGQREIDLLPDGVTTDGRYHWTVRLFEGKPVLILADWCRVVAMLGPDPYGNWVNHHTQNFLVAAPPVGFDIPQEPDEVALWNEIVNLNEYELPDRFESTDVVVDIGAHCGIFTTLCLAKGAGRVVAVEPQPDNFLKLRNNTSSHYAGRVILVPAAAWRCDQDPGHLFIAQQDGARHSGGWSAVGTKSGLTVNTVPFDIIVKLSAPVRLVKLDCEGSEWCILDTFKDWSLVQAWCGEYHHAKLDEATTRLTALLKPHYANLKIVSNPNSDTLGHFWAW